MADMKFSFFENYYIAIEKIKDPVRRAQYYDAFIRYGLYQEEPQDDEISASIQLASLSLNKSRSLIEEKSNMGKKGGHGNSKASDEEYFNAIKELKKEKSLEKITSKNIQEWLKENRGIEISVSTVERKDAWINRFKDAEKYDNIKNSDGSSEGIGQSAEPQKILNDKKSDGRPEGKENPLPAKTSNNINSVGFNF